MTNLKCLLICAVVTFMSCNSSEQKQESLPVIKGYNASEELVNGTNLDVDFFDIVPLETNKSYLLSTDIISRVESIDSLIIIQTSDGRLLSFDYSGKFHCTYGAQGRGPEEYINLSTFYIDKERRIVSIIDNFTGKNINFNLDGKYLSTKTYPQDAFYMTYSGILINKDSFLKLNLIYNDFNTVYSIYNLESEEEQPIFDFPVKTDGIGVPVGRTPVSFYGDTIKAIVPFDNRIYEITSSGLNPISVIHTDMTLVSQKQLEAVADFSIMTYFDYMNKDYFTGFNSIYETENHMLLSYFNSSYFMVDKRDNIGRLYSYCASEIDPEESVIDVLPLLNIMTTSSEHFIGVYDIIKLKDIVTVMPENTNDIYLQKIKKLIDQLSVYDNPCLLFYKLK